MAATHYVTLDRFPLTLCGVNIEVKTGADWILEGDTDGGPVTCQNCLKLRNGVSMGKSYTTPEEGKVAEALSEEEQHRQYLRDRSDRVFSYRKKIQSLLMDIRVLMGDSKTNEEVGEFIYAVEWMEGADFRLSMIMTHIEGQIKELSKDEK